MRDQHIHLDSSARIDDTALEQVDAREHLGGVSWLPEPSRAYQITKRLFDVVCSFVLLLFLAPVILLIAAVIKLTSSGPVFYRQRRVGYRGMVFSSLKFRTMRADVPARVYEEYLRNLLSGEPSRPHFSKLKNDPRVTGLGRWLRRTSLDELPQLFNVLRGDMTLVGPRPALPYEIGDYEEWQKLRFSRKPGLTGLWQVEGRYRTTFDEMVKKDIEYISRASILLDVEILLERVS